MTVCFAHTVTVWFKRRRNNGGERRARVRRERFWLGWRWCMLDEVEDNELFDADAHLAAQIFEDSDSRSCVKSITIENLLMNCEHWRMKFTWQEKKKSRTSKAVFISQNTVYLEFSVFSNSKFHYNVKSNSISLFFLFISSFDKKTQNRLDFLSKWPPRRDSDKQQYLEKLCSYFQTVFFSWKRIE